MLTHTAYCPRRRSSPMLIPRSITAVLLLGAIGLAAPPMANATPERVDTDTPAIPFIVPYVVASGSGLPTLPAGIELTNIEVAGNATFEGGVFRALGDEPAEAEITVTLVDTADDNASTSTYTITVLPEAISHELLAYDRHPTSAAQANNADIAMSMHLAVDGEPLFHNYGIFFPRVASPPPPLGTQDDILRSLSNPHIAYLADGSFGMVATRTARGGDSDGTQTSSVLLATSDDLMDYDELGLLDLGVVDGVNQPAFTYHSASDSYVITWTNNAGTAYYATFDDFSPTAMVSPAQRGKVEIVGNDANSNVADFHTGNAIPITQEVAQQLAIRFDPIRNTHTTLPQQINIDKEADFDATSLPERIELNYDDGSTNDLAIEWNTDDIAAVNTSQPGRYRIRGNVKQELFPSPLANERADPMIVPFDFNGDQHFLMVATKDLNLDPINNDGRPTGMPLRMARSISELADDNGGAEHEVDLLSHGSLDAYNEVMTGCFWAPELHLIDTTLSILFMPCYDDDDGTPDMWTGRASITQLKKDSDGQHLHPLNPDNWTPVEHVTRADGSALNQLQDISLDMTYFVDAGQAYYAWQMLGSVFIATMDPAEPTRLTSEPTRIIAPEYAWDNTIAEGANVFIRDGSVHMLYSGSLVGDTYTTGLATAPSGTNLTDPTVWQRLNYPVHKSEPFDGEYLLGTGHGAWSHDEDGNQIYVFHVRTDHHGLTGRDTFVQRVHWTSQGLPRFNVETEHELAPQFRDIAVTVVIGDS